MPARSRPPTVRRRRLAAELLSLRIAVGLTREQVGEETGLSTGALFRIEKAQTRPQKRTLKVLLDLYGVADKERRAELEALLRQSGEAGWLQKFEESLPIALAAFASFEAEASRESIFELCIVPGLLQTTAYAQTIIRAVLPEVENNEIESRVEVRMSRQQAVLESTKTSLWAILDEGVIRRSVGGAEVMRDQLTHLLAAASRPNITLQVIPFGAGAHGGMPGSFLMLEFPEPDPPLVYTENAGGGLFLETDRDVHRYRASFQHLAAQALSPDDSLKVIKETAEAVQQKERRDGSDRRALAQEHPQWS